MSDRCDNCLASEQNLRTYECKRTLCPFTALTAAEKRIAELEDRLSQFPLLEAKWLDPECQGACQSLVYKARATQAEKDAHYSKGVADLAMQHRDEAEAKAEHFRKALGDAGKDRIDLAIKLEQAEAERDAPAAALREISMVRDVDQGMGHSYTVPALSAAEAQALACKTLASLPAVVQQRQAMASWMSADQEQPKPHRLYRVFDAAREALFDATPCYGMHAPWWVPRNGYTGAESDPIPMAGTHWREAETPDLAALLAATKPLAGIDGGQYEDGCYHGTFD